MAVYISLTVAVLILGYFVNPYYRRQFNIATAVNDRTAGVSKQGYVNRIMLFCIFLLLFFVSAVRVGTGNDYWVYRTGFLQIYVGDTPVAYEWGFQAVVLLMQKIFYRDCYRLIFALFSLLIALFFVKGLYDLADWFFCSLFIFMANGFYFMSFSNVRYYLAIGLCLCALRPLFDKKYVKFVIWILVAALFHKTALLCLVAYPVAYFLKWNKKTVWLIPTAIVGLILGKSIIRWLLFKIYVYYEGDPLDSSTISYVNIAKCGAILIMCLLFYKDTILKDTKAEMLFNLNLFAFLLYSFAYYIPELTRICYYFIIGQVFLIPKVLMGIKNKYLRWFFIGGIFLAYSMYFAMFLRNGSKPGINILPYLSWLFG